MSFQYKTRKILLIIGILISILLISLIAVKSGIFIPYSQNSPHNPSSGSIPGQTDIDNAQHLFDSKGVPFLRVTDLGDVRNPAFVALYALGYAGVETYSNDTVVEINPQRFQNCIDWLKENIRQTPEGHYVWYYNFDNTYNDVTIHAPWYSAFGQATGIEALLISYNETENPDDLNRARQAAEVLFTPIDQGGLLYQKGNDIWFEEVPFPKDNPPHILNGHMRTLIAIKKLYTATGDERYLSYYQRGLSTLERWLPLYDTGYWLRYDLNPKKIDLCFRFTNPYGYNLTPIAIDSISLMDPLTKETVMIDVSSSIDANGNLRIAGNDWGQRDSLDGRTIRRIMPIQPLTYQEDLSGSFNPPATYFYLRLPSTWNDNLRSDWLVMTVRYKDEQPGNVMVQMRSIAPGPAFQNLRDGDLLLTGSGQWREWKIPLRSTDLGYWVGMPYAEKHTQYLETLGKDSARIMQWAVVAKGYENLAKEFSMEDMRVVHLESLKLPEQSPGVPVYQLDSDGVLMQFVADENTTITNGRYIHDSSSPQPGYPIYSPYILSEQMIKGPQALISGFYLNFNSTEVQKAPAMFWLLNKSNYLISDNSVIYEYNFKNIYNDVVSPAPWQSAFGQASVIKAFEYAIDTKMYDDSILREHLLKCLLAYDVSVENNGLQSKSRNNQIFFEEVPQKTHILNADILSINQLNQSQRYVHNDALSLIEEQAFGNLKNVLYLYDSGYWLKYDQNPKKEFLFQIDWIRGNSSPLIDEIILENPQTQNSTVIEVGAEGIFSSYPSISGTDWKSRELVDGRSVRSFENGYLKRRGIVQGGTQQNVYFLMPLPDRNVTEGFDVPPQKMIIKYKDVAEGEFALKIQAINEGNNLSFVHLQNGLIRCNGDQQWKTATILVRPQEMGWYVGAAYQKYHVDQLYELANRTADWFIQQSAEKQEYYLNAKESHTPVIIVPVHQNQIVMTNLREKKIEPPTQYRDVAENAGIISSSPTYPGYGIENALDGDPDDDYTAFSENPLPHNFTLDLYQKYPVYGINITWESDQNYGTDYDIDFLNALGDIQQVIEYANQSGKYQDISFERHVNASKIRFNLYSAHGQQRLLMRQFRVWTEFKLNN